MKSLTAQFEYYAAKTFFASAWADQCEESEQASIISGEEIFNIMPDEIDTAATHAAKTLRMGIESANAQSIDVLMQYIERNASGDRDATIESFGHYAAMQAMGHGVGLNDAFGGCAKFIAVPYVEFGSHSMEKDYF